jgi:putative transposase
MFNKTSRSGTVGGTEVLIWPGTCLPDSAVSYNPNLVSIARFNPTAFRRSALSRLIPARIGGMAEYRHSAHAVYDLKYHMIWCTKYRKKILRGRIAERARDLIRQICAARNVTIIRGAVSPDHIHLLVAAPPVLAPAKLAQSIKGRSSRLLQSEFPELGKQYWGQHMWARGYFCATVGAVDEATIKAYIENQKWDEDDDSFKITAPTKP